VIATTFSHPIDDLRDAHYLVKDLTEMKAEARSQGKGIALKFTPLIV
jgi:hypothetical protein